jgi:hypothetical protein
MLIKNLFYIDNSSTNSSSITVGPLDSFVTRPPTARAFSKSEEVIFERLIIRTTVSEGFSLRWLKNKEVQELF